MTQPVSNELLLKTLKAIERRLAQIEEDVADIRSLLSESSELTAVLLDALDAEEG